MKTTQQKAIIYDNTCPMCQAYTKGFVKFGFLGQQNRIAFAELKDQSFIAQMDLQRSKHEIPLVDLNNGETIYGLDALLFILSGKWPLIGKVIRVKPVYWFFKRFYATVSYNRRIIVPSQKQETLFDCAPDFNLKYRSTFIVFAVLFSSLITWWFGTSTAHYIHTNGGGTKMLLIAGSGWALQFISAFFFMKQKTIDYAGHLATIMIIGVLLLIPGIVLSAITHYRYVLIPLVSVCISSGMMLWQHIKRINHLELNKFWTFFWFIGLQATAVFWTIIFYFNKF
ncbi:MAG: hypothetical protein JWP12_2314 [Bacteroidetes bacterium]|nr:hypothetical protein [Bacteroidota bacterium]